MYKFSLTLTPLGKLKRWEYFPDSERKKQTTVTKPTVKVLHQYQVFCV